MVHAEEANKIGGSGSARIPKKSLLFRYLFECVRIAELAFHQPFHSRNSFHFPTLGYARMMRGETFNKKNTLDANDTG